MSDEIDATAFIANGPWEYGFQTGGPNFTYGLGGGTGISALGPDTGVEGSGGLTGVRGDSDDSAGVYGDAENGAVGVSGLAKKNNGVRGETWSLDPAHAGVSGRSGFGGVGVSGVASSAMGNPPTGVGVRGTGDKTGILGLSSIDSGTGVTGTSKKGVGVVGSSDSGIGVQGWSFGDTGAVFGVGKIGVYGSGSQYGVSGYSTENVGVYATCGGNVWQVGGRFGPVPHRVPGVAAGFFDGPVIVHGPHTVYGTKSAAVPHPDGSYRLLYAVESPESWFGDFGEAKLIQGRAEGGFCGGDIIEK